MNNTRNKATRRRDSSHVSLTVTHNTGRKTASVLWQSVLSGT